MAHFNKLLTFGRWRTNIYRRNVGLYFIGIIFLCATVYADTKILGVTEIQSLNLTVQTRTSDFTVAGDKTIYLCNAFASPITVTLLSVESQDVKNRVYHIKKTDSSTNKVTIDANGTQTIDGALTAVLESQFESILIASDGSSNWSIH